MDRARKLIVGCFLALALLAAPAWAFFSLTDAKNAMVDFLLEQLSTEGEFVITADEVKELDEGSTAITGLKIADANGVWFTAKSLSFTWDPSRLLSGEVEFNSLIMSDVEVLRAPADPPAVEVKEETGPKEDDGVFAWPRSPLTIRIENLALERVSIAEPVLGHAISFDARGAARDEGDIQAVSLTVNRTDRIAGQIAFAYSRDFSENTLKVDLTAREDAGGLVAHLASLPQDAASALTLKADGPPTDWKAAFDLDLAETIKADGRATVSYQGLVKVEAAFTARPGPQLNPDLSVLLGERADLVARIEQRDDGTIRIDEGRIASPELSLTASGNFAPNTGSSDLKITFRAGGRLAEPIDGVDFRLARFDGDVTGPVGALRARGDLRLEGLKTEPADVATADLTIDVQSTGAAWARRTNLDVSGRTTGLRLDQLGADVIGDARLALKGALLGQALTLENASLESKVLTLKASGAGNLAAPDFDLKLAVSAPDLAPVAAAYGHDASGAIDLNGTYRQRGDQIGVDAATELRDFVHPLAEADRLRLDGTVRISGEVIEVDLSGKGQALRLDKLGPDVLGNPLLTVKGRLAGDALRLETASLDSRLIKLTASGNGDLKEDAFDLTFDLGAPDLAPAARAYGVDAKGAIGLRGQFRQRGKDVAVTAATELTDFAHAMADAKKLRLDGTVAIVGKTTRFDLQGRGEALRLDRIDAALLPQATLAAKGALTGEALTLEAFDLSSPLITAAGAGQLNTATSEGRMTYEIGLPDLAVIATRYDIPLSGALSMRGTATLPGADAPKLDGEMEITGLGFEGVRYGRLSLTHDVAVSEQPSGEIGLTLRDSPYGEVGIDTTFDYTEPRLTLRNVAARALGLTATGDLSVRTDRTLADGKLKIQARSLAAAGREAGLALSGNGWGTLMLTSREGRQDANLTLDLRDVSVDGTRIGAADVAARLRDVLGRPVVDVRLRASAIAAGDVRLTNATASASGPLNGLTIRAETYGELDDRSLIAAVDARVSAGGPTTAARVTRLQATLGEERIALAAPLEIRSSGGVTRLRGLDLTLPDEGRLAGDLTVAGRPITGNLTVRLPSLVFLKRFADVPIKAGGAEADLTFDRRGGRGRLDATGLVFEEVDAPGALALTATSEWTGRRLSFEAALAGGFGDPLRATGTLPLAYSGGLPQIARRGPIDTRLKWIGEIGELWALAPAPGHVVTGRTNIDLSVAGDISNPKLSGGVEISDGSYQNLDLGTILTDLTLGTTLIGGGDLGLSLSANDGAKGRVTVEGRVALDASGIDLKTKVDKAVLVRRDDVIARIDGEVAIKGPATALDVTGNLVIQDAEVRLVNASTPSIITLENVRIKGEKPKKARDSESTVDLDLKISSPGRIFVRGRGLDSQWGANVQVTGTAAAPVVLGAIERERGRLDLIGKAFDLTRGRITFDGGKTIDPRIDVALTRATSDLTGSILVTGRASAPELTFTSTPNLPEDEIMPRLLFGKSRQALTGSQAIQLSLGLATLMDGGAGTLDQVRSAVGVDQLRIDQDESGNTSVTVGKEVADGVFVGTERSLDGDGGTKVTVEIDVFDNVTIDTEIDSDGGASVGVEWKKDF